MVTPSEVEYGQVFYPKRLAIMDPFEDKNTLASDYLEALKAYGFSGSLFLVSNQKYQTERAKVVPSLLDLDSPIDLLVTAGKGRTLYHHLEQAIARDTGAVLLLNSEVQESEFPPKLKLYLQTSRTRLIGPGSFGIYSPTSGITLINGSDFPANSGDIGLISQPFSGACEIIYSSIGRGLRFSLAVETGREYDLSLVEMLDYFANDPKTKLTGAFIDSNCIDQKLLCAIKNHLKRKPLILLHQPVQKKVEPSSSRKVLRSIVKSTGAAIVGSPAEMVDCLMAFSYLKNAPIKNPGVIAYNSSQVAEIKESAQQQSFCFPSLDEGRASDEFNRLSNVVDRLCNPANLEPYHPHQAVALPLLDLYAKHPSIEMAIVSYGGSFFNQLQRAEESIGSSQKFQRHLVEKAEKLKNKAGKEMVIILQESSAHPDLWDLEQKRIEARATFTQQGIPCFDSVQSAFFALSRLNTYYQGRDQQQE